MKKLEQFILDQFFVIIAAISVFWLSLVIYGLLNS
jgi:hypothetical protein